MRCQPLPPGPRWSGMRSPLCLSAMVIRDPTTGKGGHREETPFVGRELTCVGDPRPASGQLQ